MTEIQLTVEGWPPKKGEAKSMFSASHPDNYCVRLLLQEMERALNRAQWDGWEKRNLGLEIAIVETQLESAPGDATNYLGGVADVLQANRMGITNTDTSYINDLIHLSIYFDDKQIKEARYFVERGEFPGYRLRVWVL